MAIAIASGSRTPIAACIHYLSTLSFNIDLPDVCIQMLFPITDKFMNSYFDEVNGIVRVVLSRESAFKRIRFLLEGKVVVGIMLPLTYIKYILFT